jgi:uncharacterized protein (TIGR03067 family)
MRFLIYLFLIVSGAGCSSIHRSGERKNPFNGTWIPVSQELGGNALPETAFTNQKLLIRDSSYVYLAEGGDSGIVHYGENRMDIFSHAGVNAGKHFKAIYRYENGLWAICYNLSGENYPESFDTGTNPSYFLSVFKKTEEH